LEKQAFAIIGIELEPGNGVKYLFEITHPKHFFQFKNIIEVLGKNNKIKIISRKKDVTQNLLDEYKYHHTEYGPHGKNVRRKLAILPSILWSYFKIVKRFRPDIIISKSSPYAAIISKFFRVRTVIMPDSEVVSLIKNFVAPLSSLIITPDNFRLDFGKKHHRVNGLFENAYLHPKYFVPNPDSLKFLEMKNEEKYIVLRFIGWFAHHDMKKGGFTDSEKEKLVSVLSKYGKVFISSEKELPVKLKSHELTIPASKMHDVLHFASLYIGDSQTMATEAGLLGTPAIRSNSFVGKDDMSNFQILEHKYKLILNLTNFDDVIKEAEDILKNPDSKKIWLEKRKEYFMNTGDINIQIQNIFESVC
jgi:predicted glycosyltransferase